MGNDFQKEREITPRWNNTGRQTSPVIQFLKWHTASILVLLFTAVGHVTSSTAANERVVHLVNLGWHVGIAVPLDPATRDHLPVATDYPHATSIELGWGDAAFYRAQNPSIALALEAALSPTPAVMHVFGLRQPVESVFARSEVLRIVLEEAGYNALLAHIRSSFSTGPNGKPILAGPGLYGADVSRFYEATGTFHLLRTCNTWAAETLASGGLAVDSDGIVTADALMKAVQAAMSR